MSNESAIDFPFNVPSMGDALVDTVLPGRCGGKKKKKNKRGKLCMNRVKGDCKCHFHNKVKVLK